MNKFECRIIKDWEHDKLSMYLYKEADGKRVFYHYNGENLVETIKDFGSNNEVKPFISLPMFIGSAIVAAMSEEIKISGINQRDEDKKTGKVEVLEQNLTFTQDQLNKLITHLTK